MVVWRLYDVLDFDADGPLQSGFTGPGPDKHLLDLFTDGHSSVPAVVFPRQGGLASDGSRAALRSLLRQIPECAGGDRAGGGMTISYENGQTPAEEGFIPLPHLRFIASRSILLMLSLGR